MQKRKKCKKNTKNVKNTKNIFLNIEFFKKIL